MVASPVTHFTYGRNRIFRMTDRHNPNPYWLFTLLLLGIIAFLGITGGISATVVVSIHVIVLAAAASAWAYRRFR